LDIALKVSARSTCIRRKYGAIIVKEGIIVGSGYNGSARGVINCDEVGCAKDLLQQGHYGSYEYCTAVHAEENAIINSNRDDRIGAILYIAGTDRHGQIVKAVPCMRCKRKIINARIKEVIILSNEGPIVLDPVDWVEEDTKWYQSILRDISSGRIRAN